MFEWRVAGKLNGKSVYHLLPYDPTGKFATAAVFYRQGTRGVDGGWYANLTAPECPVDAGRQVGTDYRSSFAAKLAVERALS